MNRRPTLLAAATLTAAAVLSLAACGGGDGDSKENDKIAGAESGEKRESPSPTASDDGIERPEIKLPKDVKDVFEGGKTGDAKKDAVLADNARRISSLTEAVTVDAKEHPALKFYSSGDALLSAADYAQGYYKKGKSFVGTTRYYDREVTFLKGGAAAVTYCMDATKTYPKDRKTGTVDRSIPASDQDYSFYNTRLEENEDGVWQTTTVLATAAAKRCMP
ncbi:lipoprotein [Streptomyces durmitorensis]|uniref:Lipoprotein n=1 Tax=Streptomyces durmitorensis TaxID=319947 RepID=A0ABY4PWR7_9ACTN|nr:hypothetical protein [Streptomyces durmitorensis]UQT58246.1 hypothetical protein M4V62_25945 [Streptomyces durmitorensis]